MKKTAVGLLLVLSFAFAVSAQRIYPPGDRQTYPTGDTRGMTPDQITARELQTKRINERKQEQALRNIERDSQIGAKNKSTLSAKQRAQAIRQLENRALSGSINLLLPPEKYFTDFQKFLLEENTGLARIFPEARCDEGKVVNVKELERCAGALPIRGGGSFYSFRNRTNLNQRKTWSDVHFVDGKFVVGSSTEFGIISEIGDVSLADIILKSDALVFLNEYQPENKISEIKKQTDAFEKGLSENGFTYALSAPFKPNSVYVLRSVAYQLEKEDLLDNRVDIIVAFRVVGMEADGSLILLWKELKIRESRKLKDK